MSDRIEQRVRAAREHVSPSWDEARALHLAERALARQRRRSIVRGGAMALAAIAVLGFVLVRPSEAVTPVAAVEVPPSPVAVADAPGVLRFPDGSVVTPLAPGTDVMIEAVREGAIELGLASGAARFEVTPGLPRAFRVQAGLTTVSVVGTVFTVRREGEGAIVEVEEGRVHVTWAPDGDAYVAAGERGVFPHEGPIAAATSIPVLPAEAVAPVRVDRPRRPVIAPVVEAEIAATSPEPVERRVPAWRALADEGRFDEGYGLLLADRSVLRGDDVEALLSAADCARLSGHPAESLAYLHRAADVGEGDARAPVVAFTLGRVLLSQLGRPREAAEQFARARSLSPSGSLASDALSREVEAWSRASDAERAHARAEEYVRLYPDGLHVALVRRYGGIE